METKTKSKNKSKEILNLKILNYSRSRKNKIQINESDYKNYLFFKKVILTDLKINSGRKKANGHFSIDAYLSLKKRGRI